MPLQNNINLNLLRMKTDDINIRIKTKTKNQFKEICENEETTMSNKITFFIIEEIKKNSPIRILTKKLIKFGVMNHNDRLYTLDEMLKSKINKNGFEYNELEKLNSKIFYGQFGYSEIGDKTHKYNATHSIKNFRIEDNWLIGDVTILNPSILPILDNIIFSPRSFGDINEKGVVYNLDIIGFDAVIRPENFYD